MLGAWADEDIHTILPWRSGRLSPGDCRLSKFHNNKGTDVTPELPPLLTPWSSLSGWYCLNRLTHGTGETGEVKCISICGYVSFTDPLTFLLAPPWSWYLWLWWKRVDSFWMDAMQSHTDVFVPFKMKCNDFDDPITRQNLSLFNTLLCDQIPNISKCYHGNTLRWRT